MSLVRWNPSFNSLLSRWPDFWDDDTFPSLTSSTSNNLELYETDSEVVVRANVAGVPDKSIDITFEKGVLWIKAEKTQEEKDEKRKYYANASWNYSYKVAVPGLLDLNAEPTAVIKDGVITVTFKKTEAAKPRKLTVSRED